MSISRFTFLTAIVLSLATTAVSAEDLAANVAAQMKQSGALKGYRVNVKAKAGTVWLEGSVSDPRHIDAALAAAESVPGVERVVNRLTVATQPRATSSGFALPASIRGIVGLPADAAPSTDADAGDADVRQASSEAEETAENVFVPGVARARTESAEAVQFAAGGQPAPQRLPARAARPMAQPQRVAGGRVQPTAMRRQAVGQPLDLPAQGGYVIGEQGAIDGGYPQPGQVADGQMVPGSMRITEGPAGGYCPPGQGGMGGPVPMHAAMGGPGGPGGAGGMAVPVRGDGPNMPNYAWPSYSAYPNYAALQYPTQYSPTAWPYIGPFYPYPQVPLGWRRVSLEWDDGWWWLDFDERHIHSHHR